MNFFGLYGIYRTSSCVQIVSFDELGQKLTRTKKIFQNPLKSCDYERISQFCAILMRFY